MSSKLVLELLIPSYKQFNLFVISAAKKINFSLKMRVLRNLFFAAEKIKHLKSQISFCKIPYVYRDDDDHHHEGAKSFFKIA